MTDILLRHPSIHFLPLIQVWVTVVAVYTETPTPPSPQPPTPALQAGRRAIPDPAERYNLSKRDLSLPFPSWTCLKHLTYEESQSDAWIASPCFCHYGGVELISEPLPKQGPTISERAQTPFGGRSFLPLVLSVSFSRSLPAALGHRWR